MTSRNPIAPSTAFVALAAVAGLAGIAGLAAAEQGLPGPEAPPIASKNVDKLIVGEFSGNTEADAVVLADGQPVLRESVEVFETFLTAGIAGVDLAALRGAGANGRDQVVLVGGDGLSRLEFQDSGTWSIANLRGAATKWATAVAVRCGDVDGLPGADIVAATPARVLVTTSNGAGGWNADVEFVAGASITGLELVDWDGGDGGAKEIAVCGNWGIAVWEPTGALLASYSWGTGPVLIQPLADPGLGRDRLASVGKVASTGEQFLIAVAGGTAFEGPWSLGASGVVNLASGDWNGDGYGDLFLNSTTSAAVRVLQHRGTGSGTLLDLETLLQIPVGHPNRPIAIQDGDLDLLDVDHDGDLDIVSAIQGTYSGGSLSFIDPRCSAVEVGTNPRIAHTQWLPWRAPEDAWPHPVPYPFHDASTGAITVSFKSPATVIPNAQFEFAVWRTPYIHSRAIATPIVPWSSVPVAAPGTWSTCTLAVNQFDPDYPDRYTLIGRQVRRGPSGAIEAESPALKLTLYSETSAEAMATHPHVQSTDPVLNIVRPEDPGGSSSGPGLPPTGPNQRP